MFKISEEFGKEILISIDQQLESTVRIENKIEEFEESKGNSINLNKINILIDSIKLKFGRKSLVVELYQGDMCIFRDKKLLIDPEGDITITGLKGLIEFSII